MSENYSLRDYRKYRFSVKEWVIYVSEGVVIAGIISYFFYRSFIAFAVILCAMPLFIKEKTKDLAKKRSQELSEQFKDMIQSVLANLKAGYSGENAFREAYKDMSLLYGESSPICEELRQIIMGLENNQILEKMLYNLGVRSHIEDILEFAEIFMIAKRSGGNMADILSNTAETIEEKIETDKEIQLMLSAKKMEQKIMNIIPFGIIFYIELTSPGFFDGLYHNLTGIGIMTVCLLIYIVAFLLARKIVCIEV